MNGFMCFGTVLARVVFCRIAMVGSAGGTQLSEREGTGSVVHCPVCSALMTSAGTGSSVTSLAGREDLVEDGGETVCVLMPRVGTCVGLEEDF